jgi:outer membrane protein
MKKIFQVFTIVNLIGLVALIGFEFWHVQKNKTAYVDINQLYKAYKQKAELEKELQAIQMKFQSTLDSVKLEIQLAENKVKQSNTQENKMIYSKKVEYYNYLNQEFSRVSEVNAKKYREQILGQLNEYISEFGKIHGYKYIYGANGNGSLMYASEEENITTQLIGYSNAKYEGH